MKSNRSRIGDYFMEGMRSMIGTPHTKIGKGIAEGLFAVLFWAAFIVGMIIFAKMIGYP